MTNLNTSNLNELGSVKIADDVVAIIAGLAATEVRGVAGMSGGVSAGIAEMLGRKNLAKGVKVEVGEKEAAVDLFVIVEFGAKIPEVAQLIQQKVREAIEAMTGLIAVEINIHIQGVAFEKQEIEDKEIRVR
ncbi:Asp23/Gls24 family envelope stress response protein [Desulfonispora thiosulfatigenes]|nr:Asp23/Gls24 family envelope stress response protein [Desulfonispora thiosulfatigenes]